MNAVVCLIGPSGAGKDSLLTWLQQHWSGPGPLRVARRTITRAADAGGEAHEALDPPAFAQALAQGAFALHWQAHGLHYGVRHAELQPRVHGGKDGVNGSTGADGVVVFNGSRAHLAQVADQWPGLAVLHLTAQPEVLRRRLLARGRETATQVDERIARNQALPAVNHPHGLTLHNDGTLDAVGQPALRWLQALAAQAAVSSMPTASG